MKSQRQKQNQFSKIIGQIDYLKKQVFSLMNNLRDKTLKSQRNILSEIKRNENHQNVNKSLNPKKLVQSKKKVKKQNYLKERPLGHKAYQIKSINQRVEKIEKINKQMQKSTIILQNQLHLQKVRRKMLQRKMLQNQKVSFAVQTSLQGSKSSRLFTPVQKNIQGQCKATYICSNTRDQQDTDSLLLGTVNQLIYSTKIGQQKFYEFNIIDSTNNIGSTNSSQTRLSTLGQKIFEHL